MINERVWGGEELEGEHGGQTKLATGFDLRTGAGALTPPSCSGVAWAERWHQHLGPAAAEPMHVTYLGSNV